MISRELIRGTVAKSLISGRNEFKTDQLEHLDKQIEEIFSRWTYTAEMNV